MKKERLIIFTRYPRPGKVKTRLIPCLGAEGAAQLQREMTEHILARMWPLGARRRVQIEVRFEGGTKADMRRWLGRGFACTPQGDGDLGERLLRATNDAFAAGVGAVLVIGADCPELNASVVDRAFDALDSHALVLGPAKDGGYYLAGLRHSAPWLFAGIPWGTSEVLAASTEQAREHGIEPCLLQMLSDVDEPADLSVWATSRRAQRGVSVIVPTLNEARHLPRTLKLAAAGEPTEIIVADGGSRDDTIRIARDHGAAVVNGPANRARQMNAGAAAARGETLLFLHADTQLPQNYRDALLASLHRPNVVGGAFRFRLADPFPGRWLIENATNLRARIWRMPYGDQALFVRRWAFEMLGGFPELPIMEDFELVRRLGRLGCIELLDDPALTSGRRWQRLGVLRTTLINQLVILGFHCGVAPGKLASFYRGQTAHPACGESSQPSCPDSIAEGQNGRPNELMEPPRWPTKTL
jgi:rSAM/selenodomain-associated transferase 2/rSAM/selenodomain-associated transferase 1